jgi:prepilin-type N-terminal cleavage/methylation domain-containing protein
VKQLRRRLSDPSGFTLVEMLVVLAILGVVLGALTILFVSATRTAASQDKRFQAQQQARLALDGLRREIHCAGAVSPTTGYPTTSITVTLGSYCPSNTSGGTATQAVVWCVLPATGSGPYSLWRTGPGQPCTASGASCTSSGCVKKASYLTTNLVFAALTTAAGSRTKLSVDLPVDVDPTTAAGLYELKDDIVLRNSPRT